MIEPTNEADNANGPSPDYRCIGFWSMGVERQERTHLGDQALIDDKSRRVCRFCRQTGHAVTFEKEAHVVPQLFGNRSLLSVYECDACNHQFGIGIENDLGNWTKPQRTAMLVPGQSGVPAFKDRQSGQWRIDGSGRELKVASYRNAGPYHVDEQQRRFNIEFTRDPYTPAGVMKAFVRVGLTLMPEDELANFPELMAWIQNPHHKDTDMGPWGWVHETTHPVSVLHREVLVELHRRENDETRFPYMFLILMFANCIYQVPLFSAARDAQLHEKKIFPVFSIPAIPGLEQFEPSVRIFVDLSGTETITGEKVEIELRYGERKEVTDVKP